MWLAWATVPVPGPIGALTVGTTEAGVALVCFGAGADSRRRVIGAAQRLGAEAVSDPARTEHAAAELAEYVVGRRTGFTLPVDWRLTSGDQRTVLTTLHESVGYGKTTTYGELAVRSGAYQSEGHPTPHRGLAAQRVGSIMGSNPVPVIVPCHRVLAADGLGGFGGGLEAKRWLLDLEGALPPMLDLWPELTSE
jgi:methylated-DNA-[protein]-cysteine S-methyltransferase